MRRGTPDVGARSMAAAAPQIDGVAVPADLPALWRRAGQAAGAGGCRVTSFYGHRAHARLGCFSNFFNSRFAFTLPPECDLSALEASGRR